MWDVKIAGLRAGGKDLCRTCLIPCITLSSCPVVGWSPPGNRLRWRLVSRKFMVVGPGAHVQGVEAKGEGGMGRGQIRHQSSHHRGVTQLHEELWNCFGLGIVLRLDKKAAAGENRPCPPGEGSGQHHTQSTQDRCLHRMPLPSKF